MNKQTRNILLYTAITYGMIWAVGLTFRLAGLEYASPVGMAAATLCMFFPLVATLISQKCCGEKLLRDVGVSWKVNRWWFVGWLIMPVAALLTIPVSSWMPGASFSDHTPLMLQTLEEMNQSMGLAGSFSITPTLVVLFTLVSGLMAGATINAFFAFGEEVGWRGYLLKQFRGRNFLLAAMTIGAVWGLWHAPLILLGHNYPSHPVAGVFMMILLCIAITPIIQYIRIKSGSVIVAAIIHGTMNATAGLSMFFIENFNDLLCGAPGLAGILVFLFIDAVLMLFDRYVTRDRIFTSQLGPVEPEADLNGAA